MILFFQIYLRKPIDLSFHIYLWRPIFLNLSLQICKFIFLNPSIQAYPSKSISAIHVSKYIFIDSFCAPVE